MSPKAVFVFALLALFSAGSQGKKEAGVDNHRLAAWKERVLGFVDQPAIFRRDSETDCLPESNEYFRRLALQSCDGEYVQAVLNEIETSNCSNAFYNNEELFSRCGTNHNGAVCAGIEDSMYDDFYGQCFTIDGGTFSFTSNCSSGCQTALRQLSGSVGCCIHNNFDARTPSVWMNCNVEQPEICPDTPNTADILATRNVDPCTEKCSQRQSFYLFCKHIGENIEQVNRECGIEDAINFCGFDKGEFCFEMDSPDSYIEAISDACEESNVRDGVCSAKCRNTLVEFIDTVGCCANDFYDNEDLFAACGMDIPDACNSFSSVTIPDDFLECAGRTSNSIFNNNKVNNTINSSGAALQSGIYSIGLIIIGLIAII